MDHLHQELRHVIHPEPSLLLVPEGWMQLLETRLAERSGCGYSICSRYVEHFGCLKDEDKGWGCGWRNIQMLLSNLLANDGLRQVLQELFSDEAAVPDIYTLQHLLESAWKHGFDEEGAAQLDWEVVGTSKWIGTTECATILRFLGIQASIVQFYSSAMIKDQAAGTSRDTDALETTSTGSEASEGLSQMRCARCKKCPLVKQYYRCTVRENYYVCEDCKVVLDKEFDKHPVKRLNHFVRVEVPDSDSASRSRGSRTRANVVSEQRVRHNKLFDWVWHYFNEGLNPEYRKGPEGSEVQMVDKPPLYFQQHGHSRTIVGVRRAHLWPGDTSETTLLILEPCEVTEELAAMLRGRNPIWRGVLEFGEEELLKPVYQLCYVRPGIMSRGDWEKSKVLSSINYKE